MRFFEDYVNREIKELKKADFLFFQEKLPPFLTMGKLNARLNCTVIDKVHIGHAKKELLWCTATSGSVQKVLRCVKMTYSVQCELLFLYIFKK